MGYLDKEGLSYLWSKLKALLAKKADLTQINTTYIKEVSISGYELTYTKGNGVSYKVNIADMDGGYPDSDSTDEIDGGSP